MVRKLNKSELKLIANGFVYSKHSVDRIKERLNGNFNNIKELILSSTFSYVNTDGTINVGFDNNKQYFVFDKINETHYVMITCKEPSRYTTLYKKYLLALKGYDRKENKNEKL